MEASVIRTGAEDAPGRMMSVVRTAESPSEVGSTATGRIK